MLMKASTFIQLVLLMGLLAAAAII